MPNRARGWMCCRKKKQGMSVMTFTDILQPLQVGNVGEDITAKSCFCPQAVGPSRHAVAATSTTDGTYYGARGYINIYTPRVSDDQYSEATIWLSNGTPDQLNYIQAGWAVSHLLPLLSIVMNYFSCKSNNVMGYWPKSLFNSLSGLASQIVWGGDTYGPIDEVMKPEMGSGHFPNEGYRGAAFFQQIQVIKSEEFEDPDESTMEIILDETNCYNITGKTDRLADPGYHFFFGGPGGACGN
ncbi:hypothetical protein HHK36_027732 [Tetracentron sinense]|uniref:Neprosin PEP catalytic domain-containing protein n=1 Tax=Tetracentron sinense TaxID=13715 RepID=A0A834YFB8_TETSI|nr:hypothetical protein HHK36_027732 [Tetracentron sinense]